MAEPLLQHVPANADSLVMDGLAVAFGPVAYRNPDDSQLYWDLNWIMDKLSEHGECNNSLCKHAPLLKHLCLSEDTLRDKDLHYCSANCRPECDLTS